LEHYLQERDTYKYLKGIRSAGGRAAKIVSDLLSFSRKGPRPAPYDFNALIEQALDLAAADFNLKKKYDFRKIEIVREFTPDLPKVLCDGQLVQQVVLNLVRNAAQEMAQKEQTTASEEGYHPRLIVRSSLVQNEHGPNAPPTHGQVVKLEIEDNGSGLSEAARAQLFEPFFTTKEEGEGTGLGLWICWSIIVEQHQGRIWGEPNSEGGARFVIELPVNGSSHIGQSDS
jgi:signal transduction histidine kinase